ncbi:hypothetical protein RBA69_16425 [Brenneria goodwinii]|uniref:hypothetical protein n=1 Tax=Brenneria goodwinii TaxID=1109412 RepID=UPI0036E99C01
MSIHHFRNKSAMYWGMFFIALVPHSLLADVGSNWQAKGLEQYVVESNKDEWIEIESNQCRKNITYLISDVTGHKVYSGDVVSDGCSSKIKLNLNKGYYNLNINGDVRGIYSAPKKVLPDYFGVDAALTHIVKDEERRSEYISLLQKVGIGVVRERLIWGDLSPERGVWNGASGVDNLREKYKKAGIKVLEAVQVSLNRNYNFPAQDKIEKDFPAFYARWGKEWIGIEPWNEPNHRRVTDRLKDSDENKYIDKYVAYAKQTVEVIGSDIKVVNGALAGNLGANAVFSKKLFLKKDFFDMKSDFSFHTYSDAGALIKWLVEYQDWLGARKFPGKIWITESGWAVHDDDLQKVNAENREAAVQIAAKSIVAYSDGVKHYFAFALPFYAEKDGKGRYRYFGLTDKNGSPNLSLAAYIQAAQVLSSSSQGNVKISTSEHGFRALIPSGDHVVVAVYNNSSEKIAIPASALYAEGMDGRKIERGHDDFLPGEKLVYFYFSEKERTAADRFFSGKV